MLCGHGLLRSIRRELLGSSFKVSLAICQEFHFSSSFSLSMLTLALSLSGSLLLFFTVQSSLQALVTDAPSQSPKQSCMSHGSGASLSDVMGGKARTSSKDGCRSSSSRSRRSMNGHGHHSRSSHIPAKLGRQSALRALTFRQHHACSGLSR